MKIEDLENDETILENVYNDFKIAREHENRASYVEEVKKSDKAFIGEVFEDDQEKKLEKDGIPICKTNRGAMNSIRYASILTASRPEINCKPIGGGDVGVSTILGRSFRKTWKNNFGNSVAFEAVLNSVKEGLGWVEVYPQKHGGIQTRTVIESCPPSMVYIDPACVKKDLSDTGFKIKAKKITEQIAKDVHGLKDSELYYQGKIGQDINTSHGSKTHDSEAGGRYADAPDGVPEDDKESLEDWAREVWEIGYYMPIYRREIQYLSPETKEYPITAYHEDLIYIFVVGGKVIHKQLNPNGKDHTGKPVDPLIPLPNIPVKKGYPRGNLFFAIPALQELSKRRGQSIAIVAATSGSPLWVPKNSINMAEAEKKITKPRSLIEYEGTPENKPSAAFQTPPDISRIFELEARSQRDADDAWQLNPALRGELESAHMTGRLSMLLKESGLEGSSYFMVALEEFFRRIAVAVTAIELKFQDPQYWEKLLEEEDFVKDPEGNPTPQPLPPIAAALQKFQARDVQMLNWDIEVQSGSSLPSSRYAQLEFFMELGKNPIHPQSPIDAQAILEYVDMPGKAELIKRKGAVQQLTQGMQQATIQMQALQKQLQDLGNENQAAKDAIEQERRNYETKIFLLQAEKDVAIAEAVGRVKAKMQSTIDTLKLDMQNERKEETS